MPNLTRKYKLIPVGDKEEVNRVYTCLRENMEMQYKAMNQYMSTLYVAQILEGDTFRSGITHTIIDDSIGKKIFEFGVQVIKYPTGETVMQLIPSFEYRHIM